MTPEIEQVVRAVLELATLRAVLAPSGRSPMALTKDERAALLEPFLGGLATDVIVLDECMRRAAATERPPALGPSVIDDPIVLSSETDP